MTSTRFFVAVMALGFASLGNAGNSGGPNVVWINFDVAAKSVMDERISAIVLADKPMCWEATESHIYMTRRPKGLTDDLARRALIERSRTAISKLSAILASYRDEYTTGLDGVIAYIPGNPSRMVSLTTGSKKVKADTIDIKDDVNAVESSFCMVMPETVRKS
ncbi:hypothetical protein VVD49_11610 [Uliginosibacterium sp. H3]|uniref:Uncharacterized protein n=1 Tax=Uliginosibacterium silvisoli TaxID=3114758 RepID=A0ABU6K3A4_9RHOO|nr:hypothetical protein [Uliginosibacterium sp. H3]